MKAEKLPDFLTVPVKTEVVDTSIVRLNYDLDVPLGDRFDEIFGSETNKYRNIKDKIRNENVGHEIAWLEAQALLSYLEPNNWKLGASHSAMIRELFDSSRHAFIDLSKEKNKKNPKPEVVKDQYKREKRGILGPIEEDGVFENCQVFCNLFEKGLFKGIAG